MQTQINSQHSKEVEWLTPAHLKFQALLGLIALMAAMAERMGYLNVSWLMEPENLSILIADIFLLNSTHVLFTFFLIFTIPLFRNRYLYLSKRISWFVPVGITLLLILLPFFILNNNFDFTKKTNLFYFMLIPVFHCMAQTKGLSLNLLDRNKSRTKIVWTWRFAILSYLFTVLLLPLGASEIAFSVFSLLCYFIFSLLFLLSFIHSYNSNINDPIKTIFHLRILVYPFSLMSPFTGFLISGLHGIEYLSVSLPYLKSAEGYKNHQKLMWIFGLSFLLFTVVTYFAIVQKNSSLFGMICLILLNCTALIHYYIDSFMFRSSKFYT